MHIIHNFPLPYIHAGTTLGNGYLGLSVWGEKCTLNITLGSCDVWDHRAGKPWLPKQNFKAIRNALEAQDRAQLDAIFAYDDLENGIFNDAITSKAAGLPSRPSVVPIGRVAVKVKSELQSIDLDLSDGGILVTLIDGGVVKVRISMMDRGAFSICGNGLDEVEIVPAWDICPEMKRISFPEPERLSFGFLQKMALPSDESYWLVGKQSNEEEYVFRFGRGDTADTCRFVPFCALQNENIEYWHRIWETSTSFECSNPLINEIYNWGFFKYQSMTSCLGGKPAGLQGPWVEDEIFPPWSNDYHFNINVEMYYWPSYKTGRWENLEPLFAMVKGWKQLMHDNAKNFVGIDDGYLIAHAVDDHGANMGNFWSGTIDFGCSAWIAQMMGECYDYTGDASYLKEFGYEFMRGVFNVYYATLEKDADGKWCLPLGVSPEYRGDELNAWGANSSFQLAALHRVIKDLIRLAPVMNFELDARWLDVQRNLPQYSENMAPGHAKPLVGLWNGLPLEYSHRHHSHMAGICPFNTMCPDNPAYHDILQSTYLHWGKMGMGQWSGWSMPWAAMIHNRMGNGDMAETVMELWARLYRNVGGGSTHDPVVPCFGVDFQLPPSIMQMDATGGMVAAILDLLVYDYDGVLNVANHLPSTWRSLEVKRLHCPGGFLADIQLREGKLTIKLTAMRDTLLKVRRKDGTLLEMDCYSGQEIIL